MITKFVLNAILHHVGMSWIICSNLKMKYEMDEINHPNCFNKGPWYKTFICSKLHGSMFEYFITHARTDIYDLMCFIFAHDKKQPAHEDDESSIGDRLIHTHVTPEALKALGATFNFIEIWLKLLEDNYYARRVAYTTAMKDMFKQIPTTMKNPLSPKQNP